MRLGVETIEEDIYSERIDFLAQHHKLIREQTAVKSILTAVIWKQQGPRESRTKLAADQTLIVIHGTIKISRRDSAIVRD